MLTREEQPHTPVQFLVGGEEPTSLQGQRTDDDKEEMFSI